MNIAQTQTHKRINISLPYDTIAMVDKVATKGSRSRLIDQAVRFYVKQKTGASLREALKAGAIARAPHDLALASEWFNTAPLPLSRLFLHGSRDNCTPLK